MYRRPFKNPISSNINEIRITATNVKVAFQTIPVLIHWKTYNTRNDRNDSSN